VNNSVNNAIAQGECGRLPLSVTYHTNFIKYWCRLIQMPEHRYPRQCYFMLKSLDDLGRCTWATKVKNILFKYGFGYVWLSHDIGDVNMFLSQFRLRIIDCFKQNWHAAIQDSSRCDFYKKFKSLLVPEKYLSLDINYQFKKALARFRCSSHKFRIETGRHNKVLRENRNCIHCLTSVSTSIIEDEFHVFFICPKFNEIRNRYLTPWYNGNYSYHGLYQLMQTKKVQELRLLCIYLFHLINMHEKDIVR
jgi:hypothetical protein